MVCGGPAPRAQARTKVTALARRGTVDSDIWDPYTECYKLNEELFLDSRENMEIPPILVQHTLVAATDMSAASAGIDDNDLAVSAI